MGTNPVSSNSFSDSSSSLMSYETYASTAPLIATPTNALYSPDLTIPRTIFSKLRRSATVIQGRLDTFGRIFPHADGADIQGLAQAYEELLEMLRPGLYTRRIRYLAFGLLVNQILSGNTRQLVSSLLKRPPYDMLCLVTGIMGCMEKEWLSLVQMFPVQEEIRSAQWRTSRSFDHSEHRLIDFMCHLGQANKAGCRVVLEAGFLDILLGVALSEARPDDSSLQTACKSALHVFSAGVRASEILSSHPVRILWPKDEMETRHFLERREAFMELEQNDDAVALRLTGIESAKGLFEYPIMKPRTLDMCADIFQFASSQTVNTDLSNQAMIHLIEAMRRSPRLVSKIITEIFESGCEGTVGIMSSLLRRVFNSDVNWPNDFGLRITRAAIFIRCITVAAEHSSTSMTSFIDAGIEERLLSLLPGSRVSRPHGRNTIREHGVAYLFQDSGEITISLRSRILVEAFRVFFQSPDRQDHLPDDIFWNHPRRVSR